MRRGSGINKGTDPEQSATRAACCLIKPLPNSIRQAGFEGGQGGPGRPGLSRGGPGGFQGVEGKKTKTKNQKNAPELYG